MKSDADIFDNRLGATLKELRNIANMTQSELGQKLNLSKSTIAHYETGANLPSLKILMEYAAIFHTTIDYIVGRTSLKSDSSRLSEKCIKNVTNSELLDQFSLLPEKVRLHLYEMILEINKK